MPWHAPWSHGRCRAMTCDRDRLADRGRPRDGGIGDGPRRSPLRSHLPRTGLQELALSSASVSENTTCKRLSASCSAARSLLSGCKLCNRSRMVLSATLIFSGKHSGCNSRNASRTACCQGYVSVVSISSGLPVRKSMHKRPSSNGHGGGVCVVAHYTLSKLTR